MTAQRRPQEALRRCGQSRSSPGGKPSRRPSACAVVGFAGATQRLVLIVLGKNGRQGNSGQASAGLAHGGQNHQLEWPT